MSIEAVESTQGSPVIPEAALLKALSPEKVTDLSQQLSASLKNSGGNILHTPQTSTQEKAFLEMSPAKEKEDPDQLWAAVHVLYPDEQAAETAYLIVRSAQIILQGGTMPQSIEAKGIHERFVTDPRGARYLKMFNNHRIFLGEGAALKSLSELMPKEIANVEASVPAAETETPAATTPAVFELIGTASPAPSAPAEILQKRVQDQLTDLLGDLLPDGTMLEAILEGFGRSDFSQVVAFALALAKQGELADPNYPHQRQITGFLQLLSEMPQVRQEIDIIYAEAAKKRGVSELTGGYWLVVDGLNCTLMWGDTDNIPSRYDLRVVSDRVQMIGGWSANDGKTTVVRQDGAICIGFDEVDANFDALQKEGSGYQRSDNLPVLVPTYLSEGTFPTNWDARNQYEDYRDKIDGLTEEEIINGIKNRLQQWPDNYYLKYRLAMKIGSEPLKQIDTTTLARYIRDGGSIPPDLQEALQQAGWTPP